MGYTAPSSNTCPPGYSGKWGMTARGLNWECFPNPTPSIIKPVDVPVWKPNYTPRLYNFSQSLTGGANSGGCGCGGGGSNVPALTDKGGTVQQVAPRAGTSFNVMTGGSSGLPSLGNLLKDIFGIGEPNAGDYPDSKSVNEWSIISSVVTALIVAGILYVIHRVTK